MVKVAVLQYRPVVGPVERNVSRHCELALQAIRRGAGLIVFPELSLTGYEPKHAADFARTVDDDCFAELQDLCDQEAVSIGVGVPLKTQALPNISTLVLRSKSAPLVYSKAHLHTDEIRYFAAGENSSVLIADDPRTALAICYELTVDQHVQAAKQMRASLYIASVAKTREGVKQAQVQLSQTAQELSCPVLMCNCLGEQNSVQCTGTTSAWDSQGRLIVQLDSSSEGLLNLDTDTGEVTLLHFQ